MKEISFEKILASPKEALVFLCDVSTDASHRLMYRVFVEDQNLPLKEVPLGGEKGLENILAFFPKAKEGFSLNLRSEDIQKGQIRDLIDVTTPTNLPDLLTGLNLRLKMHLQVNDTSLALFRHTYATLAVLSNARRVDSTNFKEGIVGTSHWPSKLDTEHVWVLLDELENSTRSMILEKDISINKESAIRATHFFVVGSQLARNYK